MFKNVYLLHGRGGSPNGLTLTLEILIKRNLPSVKFHRPALAHANANVSAAASYEYLKNKVVPGMVPDSLVVGLDLGGTFAARLSDDFPSLNLKVMAISSPTYEGTFQLWQQDGPLNDNLYALFSSHDEELKDRNHWADHTKNICDVMWLRSHKLNNQKYSLSRIIEAFIRGVDFSTAVESVFTPQSLVGTVLRPRVDVSLQSNQVILSMGSTDFPALSMSQAKQLIQDLEATVSNGSCDDFASVLGVI